VIKTFASLLPFFLALALYGPPAAPGASADTLTGANAAACAGTAAVTAADTGTAASTAADTGTDANAAAACLICYMNFDADGNWFWESENYSAGEGLSGDETAYSALSRLLEIAACVPEGAKVTGAAVSGGLLRLNMSEETFNAGGCEAERVFAAQLLRTALSLPGVEKVTLMLDNRPVPLAEGTLIVGESGWEKYFSA